MSKIEELQRKIDELQKELNELEKQEKGGRWKPEVGEIYYLVNTYGSVVETTNKGTCVDEDAIALGNKFKTKEGCEFATEKLKVMEELRQFAEPKDRKWDGAKKHWYFWWHCTDEELRIERATFCKRNDIYFESKEMAEKAVEAVGESRIKEFYLEVE